MEIQKFTSEWKKLENTSAKEWPSIPSSSHTKWPCWRREGHCDGYIQEDNPNALTKLIERNNSVRPYSNNNNDSPNGKTGSRTRVSWKKVVQSV